MQAMSDDDRTNDLTLERLTAARAWLARFVADSRGVAGEHYAVLLAAAERLLAMKPARDESIQHLTAPGDAGEGKACPLPGVVPTERLSGVGWDKLAEMVAREMAALAEERRAHAETREAANDERAWRLRRADALGKELTAAERRLEAANGLLSVASDRLTAARSALESLPVGALGDNSEVVASPIGEVSVNSWPIRDEMIHALSTAISELAAHLRGEVPSARPPVSKPEFSEHDEVLWRGEIPGVRKLLLATYGEEQAAVYGDDLDTPHFLYIATGLEVYLAAELARAKERGAEVDRLHWATADELFSVFCAHSDDEPLSDKLTVGDVRRAVRERGEASPAQADDTRARCLKAIESRLEDWNYASEVADDVRCVLINLGAEIARPDDAQWVASVERDEVPAQPTIGALAQASRKMLVEALVGSAATSGAACRDAADERQKRLSDTREWRLDLMTFARHLGGCVVATAMDPCHPACDCGLRQKIADIDGALATGEPVVDQAAPPTEIGLTLWPDGTVTDDEETAARVERAPREDKENTP